MFEKTLDKIEILINEATILREGINSKDNEIAELKQQLSNKEILDAEELSRLDKAIAKLETAIKGGM